MTITTYLVADLPRWLHDSPRDASHEIHALGCQLGLPTHIETWGRHPGPENYPHFRVRIGQTTVRCLGMDGDAVAIEGPEADRIAEAIEGVRW